MKTGINKFVKNPLRELIENHARRPTSETAGSKNGSPSVGLAVSGHPWAVKSWKLESGVWMLELRNWIMEPRSQKLEPGSWKLHSGDPGTFWEIECRTALQVTGKRGPVDPSLKYISRYIKNI